MHGTIWGRVCGWWGGGEEGGQGGATIGLVGGLGLGEVTVAAQACELKDRRWDAEHLSCCRHLVGEE